MVKEEATELVGGYILSITFLFIDPAPTGLVQHNLYALITNNWFKHKVLPQKILEIQL